jgi:hypothetical protein
MMSTTPAANRGDDKTHIKQRVNYTELSSFEQCNFELEECRIESEHSEIQSNMQPADWQHWLSEVCYD